VMVVSGLDSTNLIRAWFRTNLLWFRRVTWITFPSPSQQVHQLREELVGGGDGPGIGLEGPLADQELAELLGQVHVRFFERAAPDQPAADPPRRSGLCRPRVRGGFVQVAPQVHQTVGIREAAQGYLSQRAGQALVEDSGD